MKMERGENVPVLLATVAAAAVVICSVQTGFARQNVFTGGAGVTYTFVEREYDGDVDFLDEDAGDRREYAIWPDFELQSQGIHNTLFLHYRPELTYDDIDSESDVDHYLDLDWQHQLSNRWSYQLTDNFVYSNDPVEGDAFFAEEGVDIPVTEEAAGGGELSQNLGTQRYLTNRLALLTTYTYGPQSEYQLGYTYRLLRDDTDSEGLDGYDEYDRHGASLLWGHRYNPTWRTQFEVNYYKGLFDEPGIDGLSQDLQEYRFDAQLDYNRSVNTIFPFIYRYQRVEYEDLRQDIWANELVFSWDYTLDARNHFVVGAGPSYVESEDLDGELGYNYILNYTRTYLHGSFDALIHKRYLSVHYTGTDDTGLTDATDVRLNATYQMTRDVAFDFFLLYRYEEILNPEGAYRTAALGNTDPATEDDIGDVTYTREQYSGGVTASYDILRWLTGSLSYVYFNQDGDVATDAYDDHRLVFQLSASTELWRQ